MMVIAMLFFSLLFVCCGVVVPAHIVVFILRVRRRQSFYKTSAKKGPNRITLLIYVGIVSLHVVPKIGTRLPLFSSLTQTCTHTRYACAVASCTT